MSPCINFVFAVAAVAAAVDVVFFSFSFFFLVVCFVLISLLAQYIHVQCNIVLCISPRLYKYLLYVKLSVISSFYLKIGGGQIGSLRYFDHHTHLITRTVVILFCNHLL